MNWEDAFYTLMAWSIGVVVPVVGGLVLIFRTRQVQANATKDFIVGRKTTVLDEDWMRSPRYLWYLRAFGVVLVIVGVGCAVLWLTTKPVGA